MVFLARRKRDELSIKKKLLSEMITSEPRIEMTGNREIIIDGCKGVIEYTENNVRISLGESIMSISGDSLIIQSFDNDVVIITGQISDIDFTVG